jgi:hypothetical protein
MTELRNSINSGVNKFIFDKVSYHYIDSPYMSLGHLVVASDGSEGRIMDYVGRGRIRDVVTEARLQRHAPIMLQGGRKMNWGGGVGVGVSRVESFWPSGQVTGGWGQNVKPRGLENTMRFGAKY